MKKYLMLTMGILFFSTFVLGQTLNYNEPLQCGNELNNNDKIVIKSLKNYSPYKVGGGFYVYISYVVENLSLSYLDSEVYYSVKTYDKKPLQVNPYDITDYVSLEGESTKRIEGYLYLPQSAWYRGDAKLTVILSNGEQYSVNIWL